MTLKHIVSTCFVILSIASAVQLKSANPIQQFSLLGGVKVNGLDRHFQHFWSCREGRSWTLGKRQRSWPSLLKA
jgi:hypothetical protein